MIYRDYTLFEPSYNNVVDLCTDALDGQLGPDPVVYDEEHVVAVFFAKAGLALVGILSERLSEKTLEPVGLKEMLCKE